MSAHISLAKEKGLGKISDGHIEQSIGGMEMGSALGNDPRRPNQAIRSMLQQDQTLIDGEQDPAGRDPRPGGGSKVTLIHHLRESGLNAVRKFRRKHAVETLLIRIVGQPRIAGRSRVGWCANILTELAAVRRGMQ